MTKINRPAVAIVDYGLGNLFSVKNACDKVGMDPVITCDPEAVKASDAIILPGVGAFGDAMYALNKLKMVNPLLDVADSKKPMLAICLGMQLLMEESSEFGQHCGLGIINGPVVHLGDSINDKTNSGPRFKIPKVGWDRIRYPKNGESPRDIKSMLPDRWAGTPLDGIPDGSYMYFVHSYYPKPLDTEVLLSVSDYDGLIFCSSLVRDNIFGCQFHPERSGTVGLKVYENFARSAGGN